MGLLLSQHPGQDLRFPPPGMKKQIEGQRVEMYICAVGRGERKKTCFDDWQWAVGRAGSLHQAEPYGGVGVGQEQKEGPACMQGAGAGQSHRERRLPALAFASRMLIKSVRHFSS